MLALATAGSVAPAQSSATLAMAPVGVSATAARTANDSTPKTVAPAPAPAADSAPNFFRDITANAFLSFGYTYNLNQPQDQLNVLRYFDDKANNFNLDVAELVLQKAVAKAGDAGFRVDLEAGSSIPGKEQSNGLNIGNGADLQQAFVSYIAPVGNGLRFDLGKFVTHMGYELVEGYDGYNDNYSRSLLFNYAIPITHTGVKVGYTINSQVAVMGMVVNGWDQAVDLNASKSIGAQLALTPAPPVAIYFNYIGGPEGENDNHTIRHVGDFIATYKVSDVFMLGLNADYGTESGSSAVKAGDDAKWSGVAGYARIGPTTGLSLGLRAETFKDEGGTRMISGTKVTASEFTLTPTYKFSNNFVVRAEGRFDHADSEIFTDDKGGTKKNQATVGLNAIFVF
jgi:predicted porin